MNLGESFRDNNYQIRGVAALAVVLIHVLSTSSNVFYPNKSMIAVYGLDSLLKFAVPIFIISTSYFLFYKSDSYQKGEQYRHLIKKILTQLLPLYFLFSIIYFYFLSYVSGVNRGIDELIKAIITNQAAYHLWYIYLVISIYLFFPLILKFFKILGSFGIFFSYLVQLSAMALIPFLLHIFNIKNFSSSTVSSFFIFFLFYIALGYYLHINKKIIIKKEIIYLQIVALFFILIIQTYIRRHFLSTGVSFGLAVFLDVFIGLICLVCLTYFISKMQRFSILDRFLVYCGKNSLTIYLVHVIFVEYAFYYLRKYSVPVVSFTYYVIVSSIAIGGSLLFVWLFSKTMNYRKNLFYKEMQKNKQ